MAQIDPELQKKLNQVVAGFRDACLRMRDKATEAGIALSDMAAELRTDESAKVAEEARKAIDRAR